MSSPATKQRSAYWDNIKGLLMLLTVFAHILYQLQDKSSAVNATVDCIYMFHMPAFVFVSGYFGKSERSRSFQSILKLIMLYYIFNSITGFIYGFTSLLEPMYSYWYLIALIAWRLTAHRIAKFKEINLILFVVGLFAGFYPTIDNHFAAARILCFYPYYMCGYLLSQEKSEELIHKKYLSRAAIGLATVAGALLLSVGAYLYFGYTDGALTMEGYDEPMGAFGRLVLYLISFLAIWALRRITPDRNIPLLTKFGQNSLWIFILHRPFTLLLSKYIDKLSPVLMIVIALAAAVVFCLVLGNDLLVKYMDKLIDGCTAIFTSEEKKKFDLSRLVVLGVSLFFIVNIVLESYDGVKFDDLKKLFKGEYTEANTENENDAETDVLYPIMDAGQQARFDNAFRITFSGDLILLE
ncbi:MAG: acyltransferase family protein, partial [Oscillospiraceae bacterium]|nr:acyltransferase family protein [Oscillospiraceae bacterium]